MYLALPIASFTSARIRTSGGFMGMDQTLTLDANLNARVTCSRTGERTFSVDAFQAQELMHALATLERLRPAPSSRLGADMFNYDIELSFGDTTYRIRSVDVGADDALHGVMLAANRLIETAEKTPFHIMTLHDVPHEAGV